MNYLLIENEGILELTGLRLMGASSKRQQEGKIGTFGTGWKYAAACILRAAGPFMVCLGDVQVMVGTQETTLRGESHQEVVFRLNAGENPEDTIQAGFTTGLGPQWQPWMALRELVSNALDEGGLRTEVVDYQGDMESGKTRVYVPLSEPLEAAWASREKLFRLSEDPVHAVEGGRLLKKQDPNVVRFYKKGIFIQERSDDAAYDYDFDSILLGEDRLPRDDVKEHTWKLLNKAPVEAKRSVLLSSFEAGCYPYHSADPSWREVFGDSMVTSADEGLEGQLVVLTQFEHLATSVGARTKQNDLAMKAADRQTMPADGRVQRACKRLLKLGVHVDSRVVLLSVIDRPFIQEKGLVYLDKTLDEDGMFCALACVGTSKGWVGSHDHLMALARLLLK